MRHPSYRIILSAMGILLLIHLPTWANDGFALAGGSNAVQVQFASGDTEIANIANGVEFFSSRGGGLAKIPLRNIKFGIHPPADACLG